MGYCPDCGCKSYGGACTNCHEEIYIMQQHLEDPCCKLSDKFIKTVERQREEIDKAKEQ